MKPTNAKGWGLLAEAIVLIGRAYDPNLDFDQNDHARKCATAVGLISNAPAKTLAEAIRRLADENDAISVAKAMKVLARVKILVDAMNTPVGRA